MKNFIIMSTAITTLTLMVSANAEVLPNIEPDTIPNTYADCLPWAGADGSRNDLCDALKNCEVNESDNEGSLRECIGESKKRYHQALAGSRVAPGEEAPYYGEEFPVSTQSEGSDYEDLGGDHKGWKNAHEGN